MTNQQHLDELFSETPIPRYRWRIQDPAQYGWTLLDTEYELVVAGWEHRPPTGIAIAAILIHDYNHPL